MPVVGHGGESAPRQPGGDRPDAAAGPDGATGPARPDRPAGIGIGEAARRVGLAPSAVRYYEQEGLLHPVPQPGGRRRFDDATVRRLAFVALAREMGLDLNSIRSVLDPAPGQWRPAVDAQIARLDERIAQLQETRDVLNRARECPADDPVRDCPYLRHHLDALLADRTDPQNAH